MPDKAIFKIEALTEGGFVSYAPNYSQFSETLDLAGKRLQVQLEAWLKDLKDEMDAEKKAMTPNPANPVKSAVQH